jgi:glycosyltransferase involved in cell wall biosynthesis
MKEPVPTPAKKKKPTNYIDNKKFYTEMVIFRRQCEEATAAGEPRPVVSRYVGECIMMIATRLATRPNFIGYSYKDEMISDTDIFILPSHYEGLPMAILEAMSAGKPIISTSVGGIPSVVQPQHNGWLIEPGKINQLDAVLDQIFKEPALIAQFGLNAFVDAKQFHVQSIVSELNTIYNTLITTD